MWNGGGRSNWDGKAGEEKNETNCRRKRNIPLVYVTDLPACVQGFWIPVTTNVDGTTRDSGWRRTLYSGMSPGQPTHERPIPIPGKMGRVWV